jgi:hypothetical protein
MVAANLDLESAFRQAYVQRHGQPVKDFKYLDNGEYVINGIRFSSVEVGAMLQTLQSELDQRKQGVVKRLIKFFGGRTL